MPSDRAVALLDLSGSMDEQGRLDRARDGVVDWISSLPSDWWFGVYGVTRTPEAFGETWQSGAERAAAVKWTRERLTGGGFDLKEALATVPVERLGVDTLLVATDSDPFGDRNEDTPLEVMQIFRQANRLWRVRLHIAFVAPGGRNVTREVYPEVYDDRKRLLEQFARQTGGTFVAVEQR